MCAASVFLFTASAAHAQVTPDGVIGGPELTGTITKVKGRYKPSGHKLILKQEICNEGNEAAGEFPVSLFLSGDDTWDADDELLQSVMIESLDPGACITKPNAAHKFKVSGIPSLDGMFAIVVIDPNEDVTNELSTTDNVLSMPITGPFLSSGKRVPGQFLTIAHPSIEGGSMVEVTFSGPNGYEVSTMADLTTPGAVTLATPPFVDVATSNVIPGTVTVSVDGITSALATFKILDLPGVDADPGAITREVLLFAMGNYDDVISKLEQQSADSGLDSENLLNSISAVQNSLGSMAEELAGQQLTLEVDDGFVAIDAEQLRLLDRLLAAHFTGALEEARKSGTSQASLPGAQSIRLAQSQFLTREGIGQMLRDIKAQGVPGALALGSYVSVTAGTVGLVAVVIPGGQPLAASAAGFAVFSTVIVTSTTAVGSFLADLTIDAVEGRTPDFYNAGQNAQGVLEDGVTSLALTAGGTIKWAGATLSSIGGLIFDTNGGVTAIRDLQCASSSNLIPRVKAVTIAQATSVPVGQFCVATLGDPDIPPVQEITALGFPSASSTFSTTFPVGQAVDGATNTDWYSNGSTGGDSEIFDWTIANGSDTVLTGIETDPESMGGFGFKLAQVSVLNAAGDTVYTTDFIGLPANRVDLDVSFPEGTVGNQVRILLVDHEDTACGGFAELRVFGQPPQ